MNKYIKEKIINYLLILSFIILAITTFFDVHLNRVILKIIIIVMAVIMLILISENKKMEGK